MKPVLIFFLLLPLIVQGQTGTISTVLGNGIAAEAGDGGPAISAETSDGALGIFDIFGNYYFSEVLHDRIRKIDPSGIVTSIAGIGTAGYNGDNIPAVTAKLNNSKSIAVDTLGNVYIADYANYRIRKVDVSTGIITTVAGNGTLGYSGDGFAATNASIDYCPAICIDPFGNMYIYSQADVIRKINTSGIISTVAGISGVYGYFGDGGPATAAAIPSISQLCSDKYGNIFMMGATLREINVATGIISTLAGDTSSFGFTGDGGPATAAKLNGPEAMGISHHGFIYIADRENNRIRQIDSTGIITTVVGNGTQGFFGDGGKDTAAWLYWPEGVAFDSCDNMYIGDIGNARIRKVTYPILPSSISVSGPAIAAIGSTVTCTATVTNVGTKYTIQWMNHGTVFATTSVPSVTYTKTMTVDNITAAITPTACFDTASSEAITVSSTTEGAGIPGVQPINIYPIPATDLLHIDNLQSPAGYRLLTIVGATVQQGALAPGNNSISIRSIPDGMYMLEVTATSLRGTVNSLSSGEGRGEVKTTTKIIKQ